MKERIQQFIDFKGISAGELATELDVQRSNISHILNGRNKPGAAFIEKFLLAYPDLNARWLLTGVGNMLTSGYNSSDTSAYQVSEINNETKTKSRIPNSNEQKPKESEFHQVTSSIRKQVLKVILLFSDGTFSSYNSEK